MQLKSQVRGDSQPQAPFNSLKAPMKCRSQQIALLHLAPDQRAGLAVGAPGTLPNRTAGLHGTSPRAKGDTLTTRLAAIPVRNSPPPHG